MSNGFSLASFIVLIFGTLIFVIGFGTPSWIVPFPNINQAQRISGVGMWMFCFDKYAMGGDVKQEEEISGVRHDGCYHLFHREMKKFYSFGKIPGWFIALQVILSISLLTAMISTLLMLLYLCECCKDHLKTKQTAYLWVATVSALVSGYTCAASVIIFGYKTMIGWALIPDNITLYHLGWSYFITCIGGGVILVGAILSSVAAILNASSLREKRPTYNRSLQMVDLNNRY